MFIDENKLLYSFGRPEHGQLGHNTDGQYFVSANKLSFSCEVLPRHVAVFVEKTKDGFTHIIDDVKIVDVSCGNNHTVGSVLGWFVNACHLYNLDFLIMPSSED